MNATALVLAAGRGTRMRSSLSKVLHPLCDRPMLGWILRACQEAQLEPLVVIGHQADQVREALGEGIATARQKAPRGTGDAVRAAAEQLDRSRPVLVMAGDTPLLKPETLRALLGGLGGARCAVLTAHIRPEETSSAGYGRIVRGPGGEVQRIVEVAEATEEERAITEVNSGLYAFDTAWLLDEVLPNLKPHPPKSEYYLTDAIEAAAREGGLTAVVHPDLQEVLGVNDRGALAEAERHLRERINAHWMAEGVTFQDPQATYVGARVTLEADVTLEAGVSLRGRCRIGSGVTVQSHVRMENCLVEEGATIKAGSVCEGAIIRAGASVGPMAHLRAGTVLGPGSRVGNFVEIKKSELAAGAKASHLSYIGDASVGAEANIGAGTITCNYDGFSKNKTVIGPGAFIGSNTALVAPVEVGEGAIVGAGSVITEAVPKDALALTRAPQENREETASRLRARFAARAARAKRGQEG